MGFEDGSNIGPVKPCLRDSDTRQPGLGPERSDVIHLPQGVGRVPLRLDIDTASERERCGIGAEIRRTVAPPDGGIIAVTERDQRFLPQPGVIVGDGVPDVMMRVDDRAADNRRGR
ncbi:MAG: hypothetical protein FD175_3020 [Beijerinckiaceae bacterium]|nr:MAG: hypothetical protein FD175_3020 [Beijerinckiaceae bacterium]